MNVSEQTTFAEQAGFQATSKTVSIVTSNIFEVT